MTRAVSSAMICAQERLNTAGKLTLQCLVCRGFLLLVSSPALCMLLQGVWLKMPRERCSPGIQTCMLCFSLLLCTKVMCTLSRGMLKRGSPMALYSLAFFKSPAPFFRKEASYDTRVWSVHTGCLPLVARGMESLALVIIHHRQQC